MLAVAGNDAKIHIVTFDPKERTTTYLSALKVHDDWINCLDWGGNFGDLLASASDDGKVVLTYFDIEKQGTPNNVKEDTMQVSKWNSKTLVSEEGAKFCTVSFNPTSNILAICKANGETRLLTRTLSGDWIVEQAGHNKENEEKY